MPPQFIMTCRVLAAVLGSYAFVWGIAAGGAVVGWRFGLVRSEAVLWSVLLALLLYPLMALWAMVTTRLWHVWSVMLAGAALGVALSRWLAEVAP